MKLKRIASLIFTVMIFTTGLTVSAKDTNGYPDVKRGDWYYPYVNNVSQQGLMYGYENGDKSGYFGPSDKLTRGQFATILWRMDGSKPVEYDGTYLDVSKDMFYAKATKWASDTGVITGYGNGYFGGNTNITREQVATILSRYADKIGKPMSKGNIDDFPDGNQVSNFAKDGIANAIGNGWITGDDGRINPQGEVVRAVSATMIARFYSDFSPSIFESMPEAFDFASGAGGWGTELNLAEDGSFTGTYHDSDMGDTGSNYPNGTIYICNFSGKFSQPEQVNDYTYKMELESLQLERTPGEYEYREGIRYIYSDPYGLDYADEFFIYTPGAQISELPEEFVSWLYAFIDVRNTKKLPCYGIYNVGGQEGFVSVQ